LQNLYKCYYHHPYWTYVCLGGVIIKKAVMKLWCIVLVFVAFVFGAVRADLQSQDSQIIMLLENQKADPDESSTYGHYSFPELLDRIVKKLKK